MKSSRENAPITKRTKSKLPVDLVEMEGACSRVLDSVLERLERSARMQRMYVIMPADKADNGGCVPRVVDVTASKLFIATATI